MAKEQMNSLLDGIDPDADLNFYGIDLQNEKEFSLFIKKCEFLCRKSQEYDIWQKRTKMLAANQNKDQNKNDAEKCPICGINYEYANAESHHHPITLFNLCVDHFQEWIYENSLREKRPLDLVQEVMDVHLCDNVEHVVLCKHCHEKYHNGEKVTREELNKIIDYKRTLKTETYGETLKEAMETKRKIRETERHQQRERRINVLNNELPTGDRENLLNDILREAGLDTIDHEIITGDMVEIKIEI